MARTKKDIHWELVEKRMEAGCSAREIAGDLRIDINTFYDRFKEEFEANFADYADRFKGAGQGNIRFTQYMKALQGNTNMLMLLGREMLDQGQERSDIPPNNDFIALRHEIMLLKAELDTYKEIYGNNPIQKESLESQTEQIILGSDPSI